MMQGAMTSMTAETDISYGIYTIERLPKGSRKSPRWDLHSVAQDRSTAENHAKTLFAQPYYDHIEVQEFRVCPETKKRSVSKIKSYSRKSSKIWMGVVSVIVVGAALILIL